MKGQQRKDESGVPADTSELPALCHFFRVTLNSDALWLSGKAHFQKLSDVSGCKAQLKTEHKWKILSFGLSWHVDYLL